MTTPLAHALTAATFTHAHLRDALRGATAVESLVLMPMIEAAAKLMHNIKALQAAQACDNRPAIGFLYADDRAILQRDGRAMIYAERQVFTVGTDPGCTPVFTQDST